MIEVALVAMTVMGCDHQDRNCELIPRARTVWLDQAACEAAIPSEIFKPDDKPYPIVIARCGDQQKITIATATQPDRSLASPLGLAGHGPVVIAAGEFDDATVAQEDRSIAGSLLYRTRTGYALVRNGAFESLAKLRDGAAGGYTLLRDGVKATAGATGSLAKRAAGGVRSIISAD